MGTIHSVSLLLCAAAAAAAAAAQRRDDARARVCVCSVCSVCVCVCVCVVRLSSASMPSSALRPPAAPPPPPPPGSPIINSAGEKTPTSFWQQRRERAESKGKGVASLAPSFALLSSSVSPPHLPPAVQTTAVVVVHGYDHACAMSCCTICVVYCPTSTMPSSPLSTLFLHNCQTTSTDHSTQTDSTQTQTHGQTRTTIVLSRCLVATGRDTSWAAAWLCAADKRSADRAERRSCRPGR
jgi:hypothetical protein